MQDHGERHRQRFASACGSSAPRPRSRPSRAGATGRRRDRRASPTSRRRPGRNCCSGSPMPIITTLVTARGAPSTRLAAQSWATISAGAQVAVEALLPGRAEPAVERAARPARTRRACRGPASGMNTVSTASPTPTSKSHLIVPSAERCSAGDRRRAHFGQPGELVAQRLREVGHGLEIGHAALVDPAKQLARAKRLLAVRGEPPGEPRERRSRAGSCVASSCRPGPRLAAVHRLCAKK